MARDAIIRFFRPIFLLLVKFAWEQSSDDCGQWCGQSYTERISTLIVIDQLNKRKPIFKLLSDSSAVLNTLKACERDIFVSCFCKFLARGMCFHIGVIVE